MKSNILRELLGIDADAEVLSTEEIQALGVPITAVPLTDAGPLDNYIPGTKSGYFCSVCGCECILAPSGQEIVAAGKNPVRCLKCTMVAVEQENPEQQTN